MPKSKKTQTEKTKRPPRRATTPEARENQLISEAYDLAEEQIRDKTASSQIVTHFLKLGSTKERLEKEKLERENELLKAKVAALESARRTEEMYAEALRAMKSYNGSDEDEYD